MERELTAYLGCGSHVGSSGCQDYCNGYYTGDLATGLGLLQGPRVRRSRNGDFQPSLVQRFERRKHEVDLILQALFLAGVSTRGVLEVGTIWVNCCGETPSSLGATAIACSTRSYTAPTRTGGPRSRCLDLHTNQMPPLPGRFS